MKRLIVALAVVPLASAVSGQTGTADAAEVRVTCSAPCYVAPIFTGRGGFVAETVRGGPFGPVDFALTCGDTVTTGTVEPDEDRIVRQVFTRANGLACDAESGKIEISGLKAGGWYWINDDRNSAVSSLVNSNVLGEGHMRVQPLAPGGRHDHISGGRRRELRQARDERPRGDHLPHLAGAGSNRSATLRRT